MNIVKHLLILGNIICYVNICNAADSSKLNLFNRNVIVNGVMTLSNYDTIINKSFGVFGNENSKTLAELTFGKSNKLTKVILNGNLIQGRNGRIRLFSNMTIKEGATLSTTKYNANHINKSIEDFDINSNAFGFDIYGNELDKDAGVLKFNKGSNIILNKLPRNNKNHVNNDYPALYLCNPYSRVDISQVLKSTYKASKSGQDLQQHFKVHIVGTTDENDNRQGRVDIFNINNNEIHNLLIGNISNYLKSFGNNDVICENVQINIPSYKFQIVNNNNEIIENQKLKVSLLKLIRQNSKKKYKIIGGEINLVNKDGDSNIKTTNNTINMLKNYLDNSNLNYTLLKNNTENGTGIKIVPPINNDTINTVFVHSLNSKLINITEDKTNKLVSFLDFIKSVRSSSNNNLKITIYKQNKYGKYIPYTDFLNDKKYTLDFDTFSKQDAILPFKFNNIKDDKTSCFDMTDLLEYKDKEGNPNSILQFNTNFEGTQPITWELPPNQINEINFGGNNTNFANIITLQENDSNNNDKNVQKLLFDKDSFVKTNINHNKPIIWEFIGSNDNIMQDNGYYTSNIDNPLSLLKLNNKKNNTNMQIILNNNHNNSSFNSYLYTNELSIKSQNISEDTNLNNFKTSLTISENMTLRLVNKQYKEENPLCYFIPKTIILEHTDNDFIIENYNNNLDSKATYSPINQFIEVTKSLQDQLNNIDITNKQNVGFYMNIPNSDSKIDLILLNDNNSNKLQFSNVMEYVYNDKYNTEEVIEEDAQEFNKNPHLYIPLIKIQEENTNYYCITNFEVLPRYTIEVLKNNFKNTLTNKSLSKLNIIPNIYTNGKTIQLSDDNILFAADNSDTQYGEYLVFKQLIL
ncbi:MAG: hypothetical protein IJ848_00900 [Alphaproteobacteria bacterium]|nr:hypothetical protein [Alphaproteobacteria bacterium]